MKGYHWPYGQVPYEIVDYDEVEKEIIRSVEFYIFILKSSGGENQNYHYPLQIGLASNREKDLYSICS